MDRGTCNSKSYLFSKCRILQFLVRISIPFGSVGRIVGSISARNGIMKNKKSMKLPPTSPIFLMNR